MCLFTTVQASWKRKNISPESNPLLTESNLIPNLTVSAESGYFSLSSSVGRPRRGRVSIFRGQLVIRRPDLSLRSISKVSD